MSLSAEETYLRLGQVIADMPDLHVESISNDLAKWLGDAAFLVEQCGDIQDTVKFKMEAESLSSIASSGPRMIPVLLYRALAKAEAQAPAAARGTFIAAGRPLDALAAVSKLFSEVKVDLLVVDPYAEMNLLTDFLVTAPEGIAIRVLADSKNLKPTLKPAAERWAQQFGPLRPLDVRITPSGVLHDRLILLDRSAVWALGQSFNHLATRSHTYLQKADPQIAAMKIDAYAAIWATSQPL